VSTLPAWLIAGVIPAKAGYPGGYRDPVPFLAGSKAALAAL